MPVTTEVEKMEELYKIISVRNFKNVTVRDFRGISEIIVGNNFGCSNF